MTDQDAEYAGLSELVRAQQEFKARSYAGMLKGFPGTPAIGFYERPTTDQYGTMTIGEWGGYLIQIMPMLFNERLVMTPKDFPAMYEHGWCFDKGRAAFLAALVWNPQEQGEPPGYKKRATAGVRQPASVASEGNRWADEILLKWAAILLDDPDGT